MYTPTFVHKSKEREVSSLLVAKKLKKKHIARNEVPKSIQTRVDMMAAKIKGHTISFDTILYSKPNFSDHRYKT